MNMLQNWKRKRKIGKNKIPIDPAFHIRNVMGNLWSLYNGGYSKGKTATEILSFSHNYPCGSPLGITVFYKTFKVFGIIIHIPAFWRRRKFKDNDKMWDNEKDLIPIVPDLLKSSPIDERVEADYLWEFMVRIMLDPLNYVEKGYISDEDMHMLLKTLKEKRKDKTNGNQTRRNKKD